MTNAAAQSINQSLFPAVLKFLVIVLPIALPFMLLYVWWVIRLRWLQMKFVESQTPCLLEIRLPKEILKSPAGMEIFFSHLQQSGAGNWSEAFLDGKSRPWFSCELVSEGGNVRFFVWCSQKKFKTIVEAQLYAQYPNVEVYEVPEADEYTHTVDFDLEKYNMNGFQYTYTHKASDVYPIKTYVEYGLDKDPKDEYKIDPLTSALEFLGSVKPGENVWIQILIQKHEKTGWKHGEWKEGRDRKEDVKTEVENVRKATIPETEDDDEKSLKFPNPTKSQVDIIAALERNAAKPAFDCMIRSFYIAEKDAFNAVNIGGTVNCFKQYGSEHLNGFKPDFKTDISDARKDITRILPFLKKSNERKILRFKKALFHAYKLRSFFEWPYKHFKGKPFLMSTEELATVFHFPSGVVSQTPTLKRVGSKKSEAPANLPV